MVGFQYIKRLSVSVFALAILASPASSYAQTAASDAKAANLPSAWSFAHLPALGGLEGQVSISGRQTYCGHNLARWQDQHHFGLGNRAYGQGPQGLGLDPHDLYCC